MQRNINYHYKSFDFSNIESLDKKVFESFNEYGYNLDCVNKRVIDNEKKAIKSMNNNVKAHNIKEKN